MADDSMAFVHRFNNREGEDFLRSLVESVLAKLMDYEVSNQIGRGFMSAMEIGGAYRNGYRERALHTRLGTLDLQIPKLRRGTYFRRFWNLVDRPKAIAAVVQEAWINGVSTRKVDELVQAMGTTGISRARYRCCVRKSMGVLVPS